jgi:hypothetical protein
LQAQSSEFKPQSHQKNKNKKESAKLKTNKYLNEFQENKQLHEIRKTMHEMKEKNNQIEIPEMR